MTAVFIGSGVLASSLTLLAALLWWLWLAGQGRHRAPSRPGPLPLVAPEGLDGTEDAVTVALRLDADRAGLEYCPAEGRTTPHFIHHCGARTCCVCETETAGDEE